MTSRVRDVVRAVREAQAERLWYRIDGLLNVLPGDLKASEVAALLGALVDDVQHEAELFAVVHAAETAEDAAYERGLIAALPGMVVSSPRWSRTLLARVLNSASTMSTFVAQLPGASDVERDAVVIAARALAEWRSTQFADRLALVSNACSAGHVALSPTGAPSVVMEVVEPTGPDP